MGKTITVVQESDLDKESVVVDGAGKISSRVIFTDKEVTVNMSQAESILFRQLVNVNEDSTVKMVATGVLVGGKWYGDRPDEGVYIDPFNNMKEITVGNPAPVEHRSIIRVTETYQGQIIEFLNVPNTFDVVTFQNVGNIHSDELLSAETISSDVGNSYKFTSSNTSVAYTESFEIKFTDSNQMVYTYPMTRVQFSGGLAVYEHDLGVAPTEMTGTQVAEVAEVAEVESSGPILP